MIEPKLATVHMKDGATYYGKYYDGAWQIEVVPHDPDVPSPVHLDARDVEKVEYDPPTYR